MADKDNDLPVTIPAELRRQFAEVRHRLWRVETTVALGVALIGLLVSLFALFISDRLWNTPRSLRMIFLLVGLVAVLAGFYGWARKWLWRRRTDEDLAWIVQRRFRRLGDRLLGIVELSHEQKHQANFSPALYQAAIRQVAEEASQYDFRESVSLRTAEKFAFAALALGLGWVIISIVLPQAAWNTFVRWIAPASNTPRFTLVELEDLPREIIVPHGEAFSISGTVHYRSFWKPADVSAQWLTETKAVGPVKAGKFTLQIPGQVEGGNMVVRAGDASFTVKVTPVFRPSLRELNAQIQLPAYLQYPDQTQTVQSGSLLALEGSAVAFNGKISRPLASADFSSTLTDPAPLKIQGDTFSSKMESVEGITEYIFNWRDDLGLSNAVPLRLSVELQKDQPPAPSLPCLPRESAVLDSDVLHIECDANDDFGVRDLGLTWDIATDTPQVTSATTEIKIMTKSAHEKKAARVFLWSPRLFRIPDDASVTLQGYARDFYPGRARARTGEYRIRVLSPEEHAELLRQQLQNVMARMEEVTRLQEKISANLHDLQESPKLTDAEKSSRVEQSKQDQLQNSEHLKELSDQAKSALQEAMKNPTFPVENIRQWTKSAQQWQKLSQEKMKQAASSMQNAQQSKSDSQQKDMAEASKKADDVLKELEKMQAQASQHMDDLQAVTLAQRLRKVGSQEKDISGSLMKAAAEIIGLPPEELGDRLKRFEHTLTTDQGKARQESEALQGEINRFFERTRKTNYGAVSQQMKDTRAVDELEKIGGLIGDNVAMEASGHLGQWSDQFQKWSDLLEPKENSSSSKSSSSNSKSEKKDLTKQLIALLRLREREFNLRDQTSVLDQNRGEAASYQDRARSLSEAQQKIAGDLNQIQEDAAISELEPAFAQTASSMNETSTILQKPDTGQPADTAEGQTIDGLTDLVNLINEQGQQSKQQQQSSQSQDSGNNAEEMAFLMRMMQNPGDAKSMALQPATGPNRAGGMATSAGRAVSGNATGKASATRDVNKASGVIENSPTEFRDALDNYFHGIERTKN